MGGGGPTATTSHFQPCYGNRAPLSRPAVAATAASGYDGAVIALEEAVRRLVARHGLLDGVRRLGLAVSGGADSVALLHLLAPHCRAAGIAPVVLHLDHGWRGAASAADLEFVRQLAADAGLPCRTGRPRPETRRKKKSPEMAARDLRLGFYRACAAIEKLDAIATGHQADDVVETLLLRLARGAGAAGLSGLRPLSEIEVGGASLRLVRPLLEARREELRQWLRARSLTWREDASNGDTAIARNAVRLRLLPLLEQAWRGRFAHGAAQSAGILRAEDAMLEELAAAWLRARSRSGTLRLDLLLAEPLALRRRVLRAWLLARGCSQAMGFATVERLLEKAARAGDWSLTLPGELLLRCRDGQLLPPAITPPVMLRGEIALPVPGVAELGDVRASAALGPGVARALRPIGALPASCSLAPEALAGKALVLRMRRAGDRIAPLGLRGSRKLQDILVDAKVPVELRDRLPLLCCDGAPIWIPGYRVARAFAVRDSRRAAVQVSFERIVSGDVFSHEGSGQ